MINVQAGRLTDIEGYVTTVFDSPQLGIGLTLFPFEDSLLSREMTSIAYLLHYS